MKIYQLMARGSLECFSGAKKYYSKKVWKTRKEARDNIKEFKQKVITPRNEKDILWLQDNETLEISILELEL